MARRSNKQIAEDREQANNSGNGSSSDRGNSAGTGSGTGRGRGRAGGSGAGATTNDQEQSSPAQAGPDSSSIGLGDVEQDEGFFAQITQRRAPSPKPKTRTRAKSQASEKEASELADTLVETVDTLACLLMGEKCRVSPLERAMIVGPLGQMLAAANAVSTASKMSSPIMLATGLGMYGVKVYNEWKERQPRKPKEPKAQQQAAGAPIPPVAVQQYVPAPVTPSPDNIEPVDSFTSDIQNLTRIDG